jgi:hypothetical protein
MSPHTDTARRQQRALELAEYLRDIADALERIAEGDADPETRATVLFCVGPLAHPVQLDKLTVDHLLAD